MLRMDGVSVKASDGAMLLKSFSLCIRKGEAVGLTGESGSGKSTLLKAVMGLLDRGCRMTAGSIALSRPGTAEPWRLDRLSPETRRELAGLSLGFVPQHPMSAFDSRIRIGKQMEETFRVRLGLGKVMALELARDTLDRVNLHDHARVMESLPSRLSGGMLQRVAVALVLGLKPQFVLADEPTAALDRDNRDQLLHLLGKLRENTGILLVSHDADALARLCGTVHVIHEGEWVEHRAR